MDQSQQQQQHQQLQQECQQLNQQLTQATFAAAQIPTLLYALQTVQAKIALSSIGNSVLSNPSQFGNIWGQQETSGGEQQGRQYQGSKQGAYNT